MSSCAGRWESTAKELSALDCVTEVLAPAKTGEITRRGKRTLCCTPWLGPSLVMGRWCTGDAHAWHDVHDLPDVFGIVGGWPPATVPQGQVDRLLDGIRAFEGKAIGEPPWRPGDVVRFTGLAFYRLVARCIWVSSDQAGLRLGMLGRDLVSVVWQPRKRWTDAPSRRISAHRPLM